MPDTISAPIEITERWDCLAPGSWRYTVRTPTRLIRDKIIAECPFKESGNSAGSWAVSRRMSDTLSVAVMETVDA